MLSYKQLSNKFTLGGPVLYKNHRGHVVAMNDLNMTKSMSTTAKNKKTPCTQSASKII